MSRDIRKWVITKHRFFWNTYTNMLDQRNLQLQAIYLRLSEITTTDNISTQNFSSACLLEFLHKW